MELQRHKRWRLISASICLLVVVLLYAPLAEQRGLPTKLLAVPRINVQSRGIIIKKLLLRLRIRWIADMACPE